MTERHEWKLGSQLGMPETSKLYNTYCCANCGVLRAKDWCKQPETPCKGHVRVQTRDVT